MEGASSHRGALSRSPLGHCPLTPLSHIHSLTLPQGDELVQVDGTSLEGLSPFQAASMIQGQRPDGVKGKTQSDVTGGTSASVGVKVR